MISIKENNQVCYLCGLPLEEETDVDHVPPKQLYGRGVRKEHGPNLITIRVHKKCNQGYQFDEDYFVNTLAPLTFGSYSGDSVLKDIFQKHQEGRQIGLTKKVLNEFERRPSGIILPNGKVVKRLEGARVYRVAWKIVRGLYFMNEGSVLPESTPNNLQIIAPGERPPDLFFALNDKTNLGDYPGVFDYRYAQFPEANNMYLWAMLFWDRIIMLIAFHDPASRMES